MDKVEKKLIQENIAVSLLNLLLLIQILRFSNKTIGVWKHKNKKTCSFSTSSSTTAASGPNNYEFLRYVFECYIRNLDLEFIIDRTASDRFLHFGCT